MIHLNYVDSYQILNFHLFDGKNLELGWLIPIHRISCGAVVLVLHGVVEEVRTNQLCLHELCGADP